MRSSHGNYNAMPTTSVTYRGVDDIFSNNRVFQPTSFSAPTSPAGVMPMRDPFMNMAPLQMGMGAFSPAMMPMRSPGMMPMASPAMMPMNSMAPRSPAVMSMGMASPAMMPLNINNGMNSPGMMPMGMNSPAMMSMGTRGMRSGMPNLDLNAPVTTSRSATYAPSQSFVQSFGNGYLQSMGGQQMSQPVKRYTMPQATPFNSMAFGGNVSTLPGAVQNFQSMVPNGPPMPANVTSFGGAQNLQSFAPTRAF